MTPESLVPERGTCERMKALGFPQDTYFSWGNEFDEPDGCCGDWINPDDILAAAPTLAEILEQLPDSTLFPRNGKKVAGYLYLSKVKYVDHPPYGAEYITQGGIGLEGFWHENPAEAAARLWIKVHEQEAGR